MSINFATGPKVNYGVEAEAVPLQASAPGTYEVFEPISPYDRGGHRPDGVEVSVAGVKNTDPDVEALKADMLLRMMAMDPTLATGNGPKDSIFTEAQIEAAQSRVAAETAEAAQPQVVALGATAMAA